MKKGTLYLALLGTVLLVGWYVLQIAEKGELAVPEHFDVFHVDSTQIDSIAFKYGTWTHLGLQGGHWQVFLPDRAYKADRSMISQIFEETNAMVLEDMIATKSSKHTKFQVDTVRGATLQFFAQGEPVSEFVLGKSVQGSTHTFVRRLDSDTVFQARGDLIRIFRRVPSDWLTKTVFDCGPGTVQRIQWIEGTDATTLERTPENRWRVSLAGAEATEAVDTALIALKLAVLCPLQANGVQFTALPDSSDHPIPFSQIIVTTTDGRADTLQWASGADKSGRYPATRPGRDKPVYVFFKPSYDRFFSRYDDLVADPSRTQENVSP